MKFGSVCSGIEAASVAWHPLGWKAAWLSEIEKFPCEVLKHHYPDVPNLGDMTTLPDRILNGEVEAPNLFCGGTPCQAFSVAGLRQSLNDARGNLSLTFCEIANAIDKVRSNQKQQPSIVFWENVPGVLNTKDNAFGCFLAGLAGEDEALVPPGGRWTNAGFIDGPQRAVAWRVLDAQYFGVAQRRRRVFVVASARADFDPAAVLFEFEGVRRDSAPSRETGQKVAYALTDRADRNGTNSEGQRLITQPIALQDITPRKKAQNGRRWNDDGTAYTVDTHATQGVAQPMVLMDQGGSVMNVEHDITGTLRRETHGHEPVVMQPVAFYDYLGSQGGGVEIGISPTLKKKDGVAVTQPVAQPVAVGTDCYNGSITGDVAATLSTGSGTGVEAGPTVMQPIPLDLRNAGRDPEKHDEMNRQGVGVGDSGDPAHTVTSAFVHGVAIGTDCYNGQITGDVAATMGTPGSSVNASGPTVMQAMQVRRLTPVECERLQGFPDNYTNIKPNCPDGPRYKALGNSWAVPVVRWIGERIAQFA